MERDKVFERLNVVFRDVLDDDSIVLGPETTAKDIEGWDSLAHVRLMIASEMEFGVRFDTGEIAGLKNVGALVDVINRKLG